MNLLLINGPNLNLLGTREPEIYGATRLTDIETRLAEKANHLGHKLSATQTNAEHEIVELIHDAKEQFDGIVINPGAYTHTSIAIRDAFVGTQVPFVEIHISNVYARESFRHRSMLSDIASGIIVGCGVKGYELALDALINALSE